MAVREEQLVRANVFASTLLELAGEGPRADAVQNDLDSLSELLRGDAEFARLAESETISPSAKAQSLVRLFTGRVDELTLRFLRVLAAHEALGLLTVLAEQFRSERDRRAGRVKVEATTAAPLSEGQRQLLQGRLSELLAAPIILGERVEPGLIGGLVVRVGDTVFDGSVRRRLERMRGQIIARGSHEIQDRRNILAD